MTYLVKANMDLAGNQLQNFVVDSQGSAPATAGQTAGRLIYVTADNKLRYFNGTAWITITTSESGEYQLLSEKNQNNGYAGLNESGQIAYTQIPTGNAANTIPLIKGEIATGSALVYDDTAGGFVAKDISTIYTFKGTTDSATLDTYTATAQSGDVYNLSDSRVYNSQTYPAGTNWAFESTGAGKGNWEPLTGIFDLSGYQTTANLVTTMSASSTDSQYPSAKAVYDAIQAVSVIASAAVVANTPITGGTYTKITYDAKGLVTGGANLIASDIPDLSASYIAVGRIGAASGVASLDSNTKVPIAQIPTGVSQNTVPLITANGAGTAGQALVVNAAGNGFEYRTVPDHSMSRVVMTITGDGATTVFNKAVNFGEMPSSVTIFDATGNIVYADVNCTTSQVTVTMTPAPAVGENYTARIVG